MVIGRASQAQHGSLAQYTVAEPHAMATLPSKVSVYDEASLPLAGQTAYQCFEP